jgi:membrane-bound metal-dependent hydrolase YbcI (DUF457 family)
VPVTPFHFGPGALVAVAAPRYLSFLAFCTVNVLIDIESLSNMIRQQRRIHTFFHTYLGASMTAAYLVAFFIAARWLVVRAPDNPLFRWRALGVAPVALGAAFGAWSHVLLDSIMHADIVPLAPWSQSNPLFQIVPTATLHGVCAMSGGLAGIWLLLRRLRHD